MLSALAKLGSPEIVGQFALGFAITAPVMLFGNLGLRSVQATDAQYEYRFRDYLWLRIITTGLALLVIIVIVFAMGYSGEVVLTIFVIGLAKSFEAISDIYWGLFQRYERMDQVAISKMIRGPLLLVALSAGVYLTGSIVIGVTGYALVQAFVLLSHDVRKSIPLLQMRSDTLLDAEFGQPQPPLPQLEIAKLAKLAWLALPLGIVAMLTSLNVNMPRYIIERSLGERELGIFAAIGYIMTAGGTVDNALGESATPQLANRFAAGNRRAFRRLLLQLVGIGLLLGVAGVLVALIAGRQILTLVYSPEYGERVDLFVLLMVVSGITYIASFLGYGITAARYFRVKMYLLVVVVITTALASWWLIPPHGLYGAALATMVGRAVQAVGSLIIIGFILHKANKPAGEELC